MLLKTAAAFLASLTLALAAAPPAPAHACGDYQQAEPTLTERAVTAVDAQFAALAAGKASAVKKLWSRDARVTSRTPAGKSHSIAARKLLKRWLANRDGLRWQIESAVEVDGRAEVHVTVTWNGAIYDDVLTLRATDDGRLLIVDKVTTARVEVEGGSGYGA